MKSSLKPKTLSPSKMLFQISLLTACFLNYTFSSAQTPEEYTRVYAKDLQKALQFLEQNKNILQAEVSQEYKTILAAVFPEIVRFSDVQNLIETASLELLYVRFGAYYADFSIGQFQMKPSFLEKLEEYAEKNRLPNYEVMTNYATTDAKLTREQRLKRMKSVQWQARYLDLFFSAVQYKFNLNQLSEEQKVRFLAAAYNRGFEQSKEEINRWIQKRAFPHGMYYKGKQYCYTDIAWWAYQHYLK
jgi:hypothetical protein